MFFDIFLDILHKLKGNLGQEHIKRGHLSFQSKNWNNFPCYPWKNDNFSSFVPTFWCECSIKDCYFCSNLNYWYFRLKSSNFPPNTSALRGCYGNQVNTM